MTFNLKTIIKSLSERLFKKNKKLSQLEDSLTVECEQDPSKPFYKTFDGKSPLNPKKGKYDSGLIILYQSQQRPITPEIYYQTFNQCVSEEAFFNEEKFPILQKIWEDSKKITKLLEPLDKLNINYTLDLTGGCVRDFILNHHHQIKDLDFMVSLPFDKGQSMKITLEDKNIFSKQELKELSWSDDLESSVKKIKLLQLCINRLDDMQEIITFKDTERKQVIHTNSYGMEVTKLDRLMGVFKTNGHKTNYKMDLLLTDYIKPQFLKGFDFDICKASFCIVNKTFDKKVPKEAKHLLSRFSAELDFWADVVNKKITYNAEKRSIKQIDNSFANHYERIKAKYPEYELHVVGEYASHYQYAKSAAAALELDRSLTKKEPPVSKSKKMKI